MKNERVMKQIEKEAGNIVSLWANYIHVGYYDYKYAKKHYYLEASHSWGTAYCVWGYDTRYQLIEMLKRNGATKISGTVKWNRIRLEFDLKKKLQMEVDK